MELLRRRYELYDTELLWAWLKDHPAADVVQAGITDADRGSRDKLLNTLVSQHATFPHCSLDESAQFWLGQMQDTWWQLFGKGKGPSAIPGFLTEADEDAAPPSLPGLSPPQTGKARRSSPEESDRRAAGLTSVQGTPGTSYHFSAGDRDAMEAAQLAIQIDLALDDAQRRLAAAERRREENRSQASASSSSLQSPPRAQGALRPDSASSSSASVATSACRTCALPRAGPPAGHVVQAWFCDRCGLRGDLPASSEENKVLAASARGARPTTEAASSSGQSAETRYKNAVCRRLAQATEEAEKQPHPLFARPGGPAGNLPDALVADALQQGRLAFAAMDYRFPEPELIACIQSGLFEQLGWAVPRKHLDAAPSEMMQLDMSSGRMQVRHSQEGPQCLPLASLAQFFQALVCTILPALVSRPAALSQWLALARSVGELDAQRGWPQANRYLTQVLYERCLERQPYAPVSNTCLDAARYIPAGFTPREERSAPPGREQKVCNLFNFSAGGCARRAGDCNYRHNCAQCDGPHPAKVCPAGPPKPRRDNRGVGDRDRDRDRNRDSYRDRDRNRDGRGKEPRRDDRDRRPAAPEKAPGQDGVKKQE